MGCTSAKQVDAVVEVSSSQNFAEKHHIHLHGHSNIVSNDVLAQILRKSAPRYRLATWNLVYNIAKDGTSFKTFFSRVGNHPASLLLFCDSNNKVFGGFASGVWDQKKAAYHGTGESFVFEVKRKDDHDIVHHYTWHGGNTFFLYADDKSIAMGGGGNFAFQIDNRFHHGVSGECSTFNSPTLASGHEWSCHRFELWVPS